MKRWWIFLFLLIPIYLIAQDTGLPPQEIPVGLASILGIIVPFLLQFVGKKVADPRAKLGLAVGLSAVVGFAAAIWQGMPISSSVEFVAWVYGVSQIAYNTLFKQFVFKLFNK